MITFLKRLWRDRRGNALVIAGASLPLLAGAAGLATDTIQWAMWKRQLQRAADSAAIAGVHARLANNANMTAQQAVAGDLLKHNTTGITLMTGYPDTTFPTGTGWTNGVEVSLAIQKRLGFSSIFLSNVPTIRVTGRAALFDSGNYCVFARATTGPALTIQGSTDVELGCGAISNSTDGINAVDVNGNGHSFIADPVAAVGGIDGNINGSPNLQEYAVPMVDPYASLTPTNPGGCSQFQSHKVTRTTTINGVNKARTHLTPGCFSGFNTNQGGGGIDNEFHLDPGVYYLDSTSISIESDTKLIGDGVTIIFGGSTPGTIDVRGNAVLDLSAPTSGTYANLLMIQNRNNPDISNGTSSTIQGNSGTALDGVIYFPNGNLTFTGSSAGSTQCAMIIGWNVSFSGSSDIQNDTSSCVADTQMSGKRVRLIG